MTSEQALLLAAFVGAVGLLCLFRLLRQPTRLRLAVGALYIVVYSVALWRAGIIPLEPPPAAYHGGYHLLCQILEIFWWFCIARYAITLGRSFLLIHHRAAEQKFATDLLAGLVYVTLFFTVAGLVLGLPIAGLVATSGVIAIVLGLALQSTLSDVFSGIALNIEAPYRVGDWIALEGGVEGQVIEINWRATHLMTATRESVAIPNSSVAKSRIVNYSSPSVTQGIELSISLDNRIPPTRALEMLEQAVLACLVAMREPSPKIRIKGFGASSVEYLVRFFVPNVDAVGEARSEVLDSIYRHAMWSGIAISVPDAGAEPILRVGQGGQVPPPARLVDRAPLFAHAHPQERDAIDKALVRRAVKAGEVLMRQTEEMASIFLIEAGVFSLTREQEDGTTVEVDRRGRGDDFGAYALLSGKPSPLSARALTHGSVLELHKADLLPLIQARGEFKAELESVLAARGVPAKLPAEAGRVEAEPASVVSKFFQRIGAILPSRELG